MRALKLAALVTSDHTLHLEPEQPEAGSLQDFLSRPRVDSRFVRSKEEIDAYLHAERDSWE